MGKANHNIYIYITIKDIFDFLSFGQDSVFAISATSFKAILLQ